MKIEKQLRKEILKLTKEFYKARKQNKNPRNLRLLKHNFGNEDRIRACIVPPRHGAFVPAIKRPRLPSEINYLVSHNNAQ